MVKGVAGAAQPVQAKASGGVVAQPTASQPSRSTYETPEERAKKQVYIIRQSSFSSAIAGLGAGAKAPVKFEDALAYAKNIEKYIFDMDLGEAGFQDVPDFPAEAE